jgi:hypothetical protein
VKRGDAIVKIALNAEKTGTYQQRLQRREFEQIRDATLDLVARRDFHFNAKSAVARAKVPPYLVYFVLRLLVSRGLVTEFSRGRFKTTRGLSASDLDEVWEQVEEEA